MPSNTLAKKKIFYVKKNTLLLIAGLVWCMAGLNVARLGLFAYEEVQEPSLILFCLSLLVFGVFGRMFYKLNKKHILRILSYTETLKPFWKFFDTKSYIIMAIMMSGGILLRKSNLAPEKFIAVFYSGLGAALFLAGIVFCIAFFLYKKKGNKNLI